MEVSYTEVDLDLKDLEIFTLSAESTRKWRDMEIQLLNDNGCDDLSYRPSTGMSAFGWVMAHQASIYDFSLNILIKDGGPKNPKLFALYTPGTSGDWAGTSREEIQQYYDTGEQDLLNWIKHASEDELERRIEKDTAPSFFVGMSIREVITNTFTHLNYHTGHLTALRKDWKKTRG